MFNVLRRRKPKSPAHARELAALVASLVAYHRGGLEVALEDGADPTQLAEDASALQWYAHGAGVTDPFTLHVLGLPVGQLDAGLFAMASYRMEAAGALAWALGLADAIPPAEERSEAKALVALFPLRGSPSPAIDTAVLRPALDLEAAQARWEARLAEAVAARTEEPASQLAFSRSWERARALAWVLSSAPYLDDVQPG